MHDVSGEPQDVAIEDQLVKYAKDVNELFLAHRNLEKTATETHRVLQLRAREVAALNEFLQRRLAELFQLEAEHEALLDQLERTLDRIQPAHLRELAEKWVTDGRQLLTRVRAQRTQ